MSAPEPEPSPANELFAQFLDRCERGEDPDFARFCDEHAEHAVSLQFLHQNLERLEGILRREPETQAPRDLRYEIGDVIAKGGMGVVMRAFDRVLQRTVAIKLGNHAADDSRTESRFLDEARITGQLDHPGIVPIYDLGHDARQRSYFTMPLVHGRTLAVIIRALHDGEAEWNLPRVLGVLLAVCEAVASAHVKGVIHRDLKPGNVMVGRFGEVYVMDWGLARMMNEADRRDIRLRHVVEPVSSVRSNRRDLESEDPDSPLITMDGDVVGTPAYMAPEQARGEVERVGPRADVYAAGAMLYHVLAGQMPYVGKSQRITSRTVLARVLDGPPQPLAEVNPEAPAELVAICEQAMAREPEQRYADMLALAADLRAFLELRVVRAYGGGTWRELGKWVRRNRLAASACAAGVLALVAGLCVSLAFRASAAEQAVRAEQQAGRADTFRASAEEQAQRAEQQAKRAESGYTAALDAVDTMMLRVGEARLEQVPGAETVRRELLLDARQLYERFLAEHGARPELRVRVARTHQELGRLHHQLGEYDAAEQQMAIAIRLYEAMATESSGDAEAGYRLAYCLAALGKLQSLRNRSDQSRTLLTRAQELLAAALLQKPGSRHMLEKQIDVEHALAQLAYHQGQRDEAIAHQRQTVARAEALLLQYQGDRHARMEVAEQCQTLAGMLDDLRRPQEAAVPIQQAVSAYEALLQETPRDTRIREGLARSLMTADTRASLDRALDLYRDLAAEFPRRPDYHSMTAAVLSNRAILLQNAGAPAEALTDIEEAIRLQKIALAQVPDHRSYRGRLGNQMGNRLVSLYRLGRWRDLAERAEEMAAFDPESRMHLHWAGAHLLMAAGLAGADKELPEGEAAAQREELVQRGVAHLRGAMARGFHDERRLTTKEFKPVLDHPAVQALLTDVRSAAKAAGTRPERGPDGKPINNFEHEQGAKPAEATGTKGVPANADRKG